jgi:hypothetical protein
MIDYLTGEMYLFYKRLLIFVKKNKAFETYYYDNHTFASGAIGIMLISINSHPDVECCPVQSHG